MASIDSLQADTARPATIDEVIEQIGVGRFQWRLLMVNGLTWAADAMEVLMIGFLLGPLMRPAAGGGFGITGPQAAWVGSATFAGMFFGAWLWGMVADRLGRRTVFMWTVFQTGLFGTLAAFAPNYPVLLFLRFLTGTAMGGTLPVDYAIMAEYLPVKDRGRFLVYLESFWAIGTIAIALLAWAFLPRFPINGWRLLIGISAILALLGLWIRRAVPESPRYLLLTGRADEARRVLEQVARANGSPVTFGALRPAPPAPKPSLGAIWQPALLRQTLALSVMWFGLSLGYYGIFTWLPRIFAASGFTFIQRNVYPLQVLLALAQVPGYLSAAYLLERWGRKPTLISYLLGGAIFSFLFAAAGTPVFFVVTSMLLSFMLLGAWGALYAFTPELFPTEVRATGMGWASAMARVAGILAPFIGARLSGNNLPVALTVYASFFVLAGVATLFAGRDTRNMRLADRAVEVARG
jgi:MFS transporter, putative metabolite:H+ symporter